MGVNPNWVNLRIGLHLDGANGSTSFPDVKGHTVTPLGPVAISTATYAPLTGNTASAYFDGTYPGPTLFVAADAGFNAPGTADFTIRCRVRRGGTSVAFVNFITCEKDESVFAWSLGTQWDKFRFVCGAAKELTLLSSGNTNIGQWYDLEVTCIAGTTRMFINGVLAASSTTVVAINSPTSDLYIGVPQATYFGSRFQGYLDDLEIYAGVGLHSANFTPSTVPFEEGLPPNPGESINLPIHITALLTGTAAVPIHINAVLSQLLDGSQSVCIGNATSAGVWTSVVRINGIDVTDQVIGLIRIEIEEGTARIAELTIRPPTGTVFNPITWTSRPIEIDVADNTSGSALNPIRLFTGVIDLPTLDQSARTLALRCTDDLQGRCEAMTDAELIALIGGYGSPAVFDSAATGWTLAQDRLSTVAASLDISPLGELRLTPWSAKSTPDLVFDENLIWENSINPQIADRAGLSNEVEIEFDYRFPRVKAECHRVNFDCVTLTNFAQYQIESRAFMQRAQVEAAINSAGGTIESITYVPLPNEIIAVGSGYWTPGPYDDTLCMGFTAGVSFDYAQTTEEQHRIRVRNEVSVGTVGLRSTSLTGSLEGAYADLVATETSIKLFKDKMTSVPPANSALVILEQTTSADTTLSAETNRAAANAAMETLIAIAKVRIQASHRRNSVPVTIPLIPVVDVDKTIQVSADGVLAKGKCARVVHLLNPETADAITEFSIAISSIAGVGIVHDDDTITAPEGTTSVASELLQSPTVTFNSGPTDDLVISITFPGVEEYERANALIALPSTVRAAIDEDVFSVTF